ncbi:MAG TPA: PDZ domain-containing protein [Pirellulales bacterium]|nr:PDZ domain-containing protein [Pirellulales bacterium]
MKRTMIFAGIQSLALVGLLTGSLALAQQSSSSDDRRNSSSDRASQSDANDDDDTNYQSDQADKKNRSRNSANTSSSDRSSRDDSSGRQSSDTRTSSSQANQSNNHSQDQQRNAANQTWSNNQSNQPNQQDWQQNNQNWQHQQASQQGWQQNQQQPWQQNQQGQPGQQAWPQSAQQGWPHQQAYQQPQSHQQPHQQPNQQGWAQQQQPWNQQQYANHTYSQQPNWNQEQQQHQPQSNHGYSAGSQDPRMQQFQQQPFSNNHPGQYDQGQFNQQGAWQGQNQGQGGLGVTLAAHATHGVVVTGVSDHSAAASAGLQPGDQIVSVNGQHIYSNQDLLRAIHTANPQQGPLNLVAVRNGQTRNLLANLVPNHAMGWIGQNGQPFAANGGFVRERPALGVTLHQNGPNDVRISSVFPGSPAQQAGLQPGDRIVAIGQQHVQQTDDVINQIAQAHPDQRLPIQVDRNGQQGTVWTVPQEADQGFQNQQGVNR